MHVRHLTLLLTLLMTFSLSPSRLDAQVIGKQKISPTEGGFAGVLDAGGRFGVNLTWLSDLDGNGVRELVVGAGYANNTAGEVWVLFLDATGLVTDEVQITTGSGGFTPFLEQDALFGYGLSRLGDIDGDGTEDLAVGAHGTNLGGFDRGAVWILFMDPDQPGHVKTQTVLWDGANGAPSFEVSENFGISLAGLGDLDGDGVPDLAVGADPGLTSSSEAGGRIWILFLNANGTIKKYVEITEGKAGFSGDLDTNDRFGHALESLGDLDGDGITDLAAGAIGDDDGGLNVGATYILFLNADGTVKSDQKIGKLSGGFAGALDDSDAFGRALTFLPTRRQLLVGAHGDDGPFDSDDSMGAAWLLDLRTDGTVQAQAKITGGVGGFGDGLDAGDRLGGGLSWVGDLNGDGFDDVAIGADGDDDGAVDAGAAWVLLLGDEIGGPGVVSAQFSATPMIGTPPFAVTFTDESTGPVSSWEWDFGDGSHSDERDPVHVYEGDGPFTVSLTVNSASDTDTETKADFIDTYDFLSITLGDKALGELVNDEIHRFSFEASEGARIKLTVMRKGPGTLEPKFRLVSPSGISVVTWFDSVKKEKLALVKNLLLAETGVYRLEVAGKGNTVGSYKLVTKGVFPKAIKSTKDDPLVVGDPSLSSIVGIPAIGGTLIKKLVVKSIPQPKNSAPLPGNVEPNLLPTAQVEDELGQPVAPESVTANADGSTLTLKAIDLATVGEYALVVAGLDQTVGFATLSAKLKYPKGKTTHIVP